MLESVGVDADDPARTIDHRGSRRAGTGGGGVLDRTTDRPTAWAAKPGRGGRRLTPGGRRRWRPTATVTTTSPLATTSSDQASGCRSPVSTPSTTRSPSTSLPTTEPCAVRPSSKRTAVVWSRRLWALVSTRPGATTKPLPRPLRPTATTDGAAAAPASRTSQPVVDDLHRTLLVITIELLVSSETTYDP